MIKSLFLILVTILLIVSGTKGLKCSWDRDTDFPEENMPLLFNLELNDLMTPELDNEKRIITYDSENPFIISCPNRNITVLNTSSVEVHCANENKIEYNEELYSLKELGCTGNVKDEVIKVQTTSGCGQNSWGVIHDIGFHISKKIFHSVINVCFNHQKETTFFTVYKLKGKSLNATDKGKRPGFRADKGFFTTDIASYYKESTQEQFFVDFLGENITEGKMFLARGHMSPDAAFSLHNSAEATYYYINAIPQWQSINNGNWKVVESSIRKFASERGIDLKIWTGTHDVLTLQDKHHVFKRIFLGYADEGIPQKIVPVPALVWKVVYDEVNLKGIVFVSVNNPFLTEKTKELCKNVCSQIEWLDHFNDDLERGQTYCCKVGDFRKVIPNVPDLGCITLLVD